MLRGARSSPTRRSSDLGRGQLGEEGRRRARMAVDREPVGAQRVDRDEQHARRARLTAAAGESRRGRQQGRRGATDRKSTRLNSSHLVISYAVFCLKKKN